MARNTFKKSGYHVTAQDFVLSLPVFIIQMKPPLEACRLCTPTEEGNEYGRIRRAKSSAFEEFGF